MPALAHPGGVGRVPVPLLLSEHLVALWQQAYSWLCHRRIPRERDAVTSAFNLYGCDYPRDNPFLSLERCLSHGMRSWFTEPSALRLSRNCWCFLGAWSVL